VRKRSLFTRQVMLMCSGFGRPLRREAVAEPAASGDGQKRAAPERHVASPVHGGDPTTHHPPNVEVVRCADTVPVVQICKPVDMTMLPRPKSRHLYDFVVQVTFVYPRPVRRRAGWSTPPAPPAGTPARGARRPGAAECLRRRRHA